MSEQILNLNANMINIISCATILLLHKKRRAKRRWWVRPIYQKRYAQGDYHNLLKEMRLQDREMFFVYTRMTIESFDYLLSLVGPLLKKKSNRPSISEGNRLAVTLRLLASGDSLQTIAFAFRMGKSTVCEIFKETCQILWKVLQPLYLKSPDEISWQSIAEDFYVKWQFPNCVGAVDGKHISIRAPNNSGSLYYNYKKFYSIILFAVCDANYQFTYVDIGAYGSQSDGGVLRESSFGNLLNNKNLNLPLDKPLPGTNKPVCHFFVGDEAFPLQINFLRPYSGRFLSEECRIFNYRLSRARRCIENAFGILAARWRIYHKTINAFPENVDEIIKATVCLHNFIKEYEQMNIQRDNRKYFNSRTADRDLNNGEYLPGEWRKEISNMGALQPVSSLQRRLGARNAKMNAISFRDYIKDYCCNIGQIEWQVQHIRRTN